MAETDVKREREKRKEGEVLFLLLFFCSFRYVSVLTRTFFFSAFCFALFPCLLIRERKIELMYDRVCAREKESFHDLVVNLIYKH
jgi:hypothetical protein